MTSLSFPFWQGTNLQDIVLLSGGELLKHSVFIPPGDWKPRNLGARRPRCLLLLQGRTIVDRSVAGELVSCRVN